MSEAETGSIVLTISDHLDWVDSVLHQQMLQAKINRYLAFVEPGEILEIRSDAATKPIVIRVVFQCEPDPNGHSFLRRARSAIEEAGYEFQYQFLGRRG
jgi:hypothetical protein